MTIKRLDHVSVVVDDLAAAIAFFTALGMTLEGEMPVEGPWVDRVNGLESVQVDIVMMRTPDGHGRLELTKFRNPQLVEIEPAIAPPNTLGLRSVMFTVESVDDTVARLRANGAELVGEVAARRVHLEFGFGRAVEHVQHVHGELAGVDLEGRFLDPASDAGDERMEVLAPFARAKVDADAGAVRVLRVKEVGVLEGLAEGGERELGVDAAL